MLQNLKATMRNIKIIYEEFVPNVVFWAITSHCNAFCRSCSFPKIPLSERKHLKFGEAKKAIDILSDNNFKLISITGGEPLMNPNVYDICEYIYKKDMIVFYMPTNGILINMKNARRLKDANISIAGITIDFEDERGCGLNSNIPQIRKKIVNALECLNKVSVKTYAGVLLTKSTMNIPRIMRYVEGLGFNKVVFSYPQLRQDSSFSAANCIKESDISASDVKKIVEDIKRAKKVFKSIKIYNSNEALDDFLRVYQNIPAKYSCWGGKKLFYLDWDLNLYKCFTSGKKYGNLLKIKKVEFKGEEECDKCAQQAFRDYGPIYHTMCSLANAKNYALKGRFIKAMRELADKRTFNGVNVIFEIARGGFV